MDDDIEIIPLPKEWHEWNCNNCAYADWNDKDISGRIKCRGYIGGYRDPNTEKVCMVFKKNTGNIKT